MASGGRKMRQSGNLQLTFVIAVLSVAMPVLAGPDDDAYRAWGKETFAKYCAACHGADAKGDGPAAKDLKTAPKDLTRIAERSGGTFPPNFVEEVIDGRRYFVAHGDRTMPIWGDVFAEGKGDYAARARVHALRTYLESIQEPPMSRAQ
jgi:mono/diheme cytochrome c family protein